MATVKHNAGRKAFEVAFNRVYKYINKDRQAHILKLLNMAHKITGDTFPEYFWKAAIDEFSDSNNKWAKVVNKAFDDLHPNVVKKHVLNLGYEAGLTGFKQVKANREKYGCNVPWVILMDPTSACNLKCTGCWAAEYGHKLQLSNEELDRIITEAKELGIHFFVLTGGEPLVRRKDVIWLAEKHDDCAFHIFTNGTLIDDDFAKEVQRVGNISFAISIEGSEETTDDRRGDGVYQSVMNAFDTLHKYGLLYGVSVCYTSKNYKAVTTDEFLNMLVDKGVILAWYFHYMPVGKDASTDLLLTPEQRAYMVKRVRGVRMKDCDIPLFTLDFQNDAEFVGGCIAGGKNYLHINPNGDVEPCVFIHYSNMNIREHSLLECLQSPLFMQYHDTMPFNENMLQPCPMLENPHMIEKMVKESGAHSTDMQAEEPVDDLVAKTLPYAENWAPTAEAMWSERKVELEEIKKKREEMMSAAANE